MKRKIDAGFRMIEMFDRLEEIDPDMAPEKVLVVDFDVLKDIITPARTELVRTIREREPQSVGELAKMVKRPQESVSRDLNILHNYGLLEFVKTGKTRRPTVDKKLMIEV